MPATAPIIDLVQEELEAYRRSERPVHLAHAAWTLKEALAGIGKEAPQEPADVGAADEGR